MSKTAIAIAALITALALSALAFAAGASSADPFVRDDLPWRSFFPVHADELAEASQLLEDNCYAPRFIVPRTSRTVDPKAGVEMTVDFIVVGREIEGCSPNSKSGRLGSLTD